MASSLVILITEFSPFLFENYIVEWLPFLSARYGKAIMYIIAGSFMFDAQIYAGAESDSEVPNVWAGVSLLLTGSLWALFYFGRVEASPTDYRGFQHPSTDLAVIIRSNPLSEKKSLSSSQISLV